MFSGGSKGNIRKIRVKCSSIVTFYCNVSGVQSASLQEKGFIKEVFLKILQIFSEQQIFRTSTQHCSFFGSIDTPKASRTFKAKPIFSATLIYAWFDERQFVRTNWLLHNDYWFLRIYTLWWHSSPVLQVLRSSIIASSLFLFFRCFFYVNFFVLFFSKQGATKGLENFARLLFAT